MPTLLAIETSGSSCSVAVSIDRRLVACIEILRPNVHDARLASLVETVCRDAEVSPSSLDLVAVSSGPGSFTGLRIGVSMAKGLCIGSGAKLIGVPTMTALFHASSEVATRAGSNVMIGLIPSHAELVYAAESPLQDSRHLAEVRLLEKAELTSMLREGALYVGPGAELLDPKAVSGLTRLSARFVTYSAWKLLDAGHEPEDPLTFAPDYHQEFRPR
ncbi:MAG: tRNA (adenosine(37)-N6)-threonylcarbamoyltransferase complex dimerization subunit type 1 TsaB [Candidatus Kapabacteria bacterium]|nr:tRNA (adenosine(37)-N6)-threonylcarbamoyltransferase complex dimerization subunit type 1 TsaB [Candidatus Kapabacteria bacterium]